MMRIRPMDRRDNGTSLAELMVSILVFGIIMIVATSCVIMIFRTYRGTNERASNLGGAQLAVDAMSKLIQTAAQPPVANGGTSPSAIITGTGNDLKFYGYNLPGQGPSVIEFSVNASGQLVQSVTPSTNAGANICTPPFSYGTTTTRVLANGLSTTATIFTYATQSTPPTIGGSTLTLSGTPAALSSAQAATVELVKINMSVNVSSNPKVSNTGAQTLVTLPNKLVTSIPGTSC